jgi:2-dehydro-3-deoxyphosphogluconate aldolase/(4S)-4-hydroxy-2-oxoglutarate aldolase
MEFASALDRLASQWVVPVLRTATAEDALATAQVLAEEGFSCVELTYSTPDVLSVVEALSERDDVLVGLGTISTGAEAERGVGSGADFLVSFANPPGLLQVGAEAGVPTIPGAFTPSEVLAATQGGAAAVKVFPAHLVGPAYLRDLAAVLPGTAVMATGGIGLDEAALRPWAGAGACAVGIGGSLGSVHGVGEAAFRDRASSLRVAAQRARAS